MNCQTHVGVLTYTRFAMQNIQTPTNMSGFNESATSLEDISKNAHLLLLPSTLWGVHVDPNNEFIAILHIQLPNFSKPLIDKGVLVTYDSLGQCMKTTLLIYNEVISEPSLQFTVQTISDLSELIYNVHHLNLCKNASNGIDFPRCMKCIKPDDFHKLCNVCNLQNELYTYEVNTSEVENFECNPDTGEVPPVLNGYLNEIESKKNDDFCPSYACSYCNDVFNSADVLDVHLKFKCKSQFKCDACDENFVDEIDFNVHKVKHHSKVFECRFCDRTFNSKVHLKEHTRLHTGERPYKCPVCNKSNSHRSSHHKHVLSHSEEKPNLCNVCGKTFCRGYKMEDHMLTHTAEKPFQCSMCMKRFSSNHNLKIHGKSHAGVRPYICKTCGKSYTTPSNLSTHIKSVHSKKKPHPCGVCDMSFLYPQLLRIHMRKHTGEKPYKCLSCGKGFAKNIHLTVHTRTHTGEKPYICSICGKGFTTTGNLSSHKRVHNKETG